MTALPAFSPNVVQRFADLGVAVIEYALTAADLAAFSRAFPVLASGIAGARTGDVDATFRAELAGHPTLTALASLLAQLPMQLVGALALDKSPNANWFVPWHQDRAVDGVERPIATLERMLALRIHLDACAETSGPLEVLVGTHTRGRLTGADIAALVPAGRAMLCLADAGDIVALRPLLLHRSQRASRPIARRVLHLEYLPVAALHS
jgi:Phytanoyl-CoA dioxygenase (PhyH)